MDYEVKYNKDNTNNKSKRIPDAELGNGAIASWFGAAISALSCWNQSSLSGSGDTGSILIWRLK